MAFGIGRGVTEVQILKNSETGPIAYDVNLCVLRKPVDSRPWVNSA